MATPMSADTLLKVLKAEGLTVVEYKGWRDRCRCHTSTAYPSGHHSAGGPNVRAWGSINGTMVHITAGNLNGRTPEQYIAGIIDGDVALPDKVQMVVAPDGTVYLNSAGRSNHAGEISQRSLDHSIAADWPLDAWTDYRGTGVDGNAYFYGIENIAASKMTDAQRASSVRICAAIARHYGWTGRESVGHGECSSARGYADPGLNMGTFRKDVMARVAQRLPLPPATAPTPTPAPIPAPTPVPVTPAAELTIRTFNLAAKAKAWQRATFDGRLPHIKNVLSSMAAIVGLQEAGSSANLAKLGTQVFAPLGYRLAPGGTNWRYLIFDPKQVKCVKSGSFYLGFPGKYAAWGLFRELETSRDVFVVSTHLMQGWASTDEERVREAQVTVSKAKKLNTTNAPMVIVGDFNSYSLVGDVVMKPAGFKDALDIAGTKVNAKYDSFNGRKTVAIPAEPLPAQGLHDDHIYVKSGISVVGWRQDVSRVPSDHNSLTARIRY